MLHQRVTPWTLGVIRAWVFGIWLLIIVPDPFYLLAELPISIFEPLGLMRFVPASGWTWILDVQFLYGFKFLLLVFLVLSMLGVWPYHPIAITTAVMLTFHQGLVRGFSYINHAELGALYAVYVLALFPATDGFAWRRRKANLAPSTTYSAALLLMTAMLLFTYTAISSFRLAHAGPTIFFSDSMKYYIGWLTFRDGDFGWDVGKWVFEYSSLALLVKFGFLLATCFELLAPLCLIYRRFRYVWLSVMVSFHFSTLFLMNIFFWENLLLFPVLLIDIDRWMPSQLPAADKHPVTARP